MMSAPTLVALQAAARSALKDATQSAPFEDARAAVRSAVESVLAAGAEMQNAPRASHRIPFELLFDIFAHLEFADRVTASHVCRYWRATALGCHTLWSDVRVALDVDGGNAARIMRSIPPLLDRTGDHPIRFSLVRRDASEKLPNNGTVFVPFVALDLELLLLPHIPRLAALSLDLFADRIIQGQENVLANLAPTLRELVLRFSKPSANIVYWNTPPFLSLDLPKLDTLELSGVFEFPSRAAYWAPKPALTRLTVRHNGATFDHGFVRHLVQTVLPGCPALESLMVVDWTSFDLPDPPTQPPRLPRMSSLVLRGPLEHDDADYVRRLIFTLGCARAKHIALHFIQGGALPDAGDWTDGGFDAVALSCFRTPRVPGYRDRRPAGARDPPLARLEDAAGRSRTFILSRELRDVLSPWLTSLALDETDLTPGSLPLDAPALPTLEHLSLRLGGDPTAHAHARVFARPGPHGVLRAAGWAALWADTVWPCGALRRVDICHARSPSRPLIACAALAQLLDRLSAPRTVALRLENLVLFEPPASEDYARLRAHVSALEVHEGYEPLMVEREWPTWRVAEDRDLL